MSVDDLDALEAAARAATPGPWGTDLFSVCKFGVTISTAVSPAGSGDANALYIAAASPDVVLALISEVRAARCSVTATPQPFEWADEPEPGTPIAKCSCPCCGAHLEVEHGDDPGQVGVVGTEAQMVARHISDWHEDDGPVLWWKLPVCEPPWAGTPLDDDWPGYQTHWTTIVCPDCCGHGCEDGRGSPLGEEGGDA